MQEAFHAGPATGAIHVVEQVVRSQHVRARNSTWKPEQMRDVQQIALQPFKHRAAMHLSAHALARIERNRLEVFWQLADLSDFGLGTKQEVFILPVKLGQGADDVARICTDAEFVDTANVDGYAHREI